MMPEMDGYEFLTQLRQRNDARHIPVVVITAKDITPEEIDTASKKAVSYRAPGT